MPSINCQRHSVRDWGVPSASPVAMTRLAGLYPASGLHSVVIQIIGPAAPGNSPGWADYTFVSLESITYRR